MFKPKRIRDTILKPKGYFFYLTGSLELQNSSTGKGPESNSISNSGIEDVNLKRKDAEEEKICPLIPPGKIWNAKI